MAKFALALMVLSCLIGSAMADSVLNDTTPDVLPAVPFDKILSELYVMGSGWLKWIVLIVIVFGGMCYAASKSETARADGASHIKNAVVAVVGVMVGIWIVNWLYTL